MNSDPDFALTVEKLINWTRSQALPFWQQTGIDNVSGGFYERLLWSGQPDKEANRRTLVQCRQTYVFAHAYTLGWSADGKNITAEGIKHIDSSASISVNTYKKAPFAKVLTPEGKVLDDSVDLYTHAFYLLASAWGYRTLDQEPIRQEAEQTLAFLDQHLQSPYGGWHESLTKTLPRRQNPHMHLFEAFIALANATGQDIYFARAKAIFDLFQQYFFDEKTGNLYEFFTEDWKLDPAIGHQIEPGHLMEWAWLIDCYGRLLDEDHFSYSQQLYQQALACGVDEKSGFLIDCVDAKSGKPLRSSRRLWPQTEYLKAAVALARNGDKTATSTISTLISALMESYLNTPIPGAWHDQYDEHGKVMSLPIYASTFYHLFCAITEVQSLLDEA